MKQNYQILLLALLFVAAAAVRVWLGQAAEAHAPKAADGVMDLRGWSFEENGTVSLDGEWRFEPGVLSGAPSEAGTGAPAGLPIRVPGGWEQGGSPAMPGPFGYGTYRLRLLPPPADHSYAVRIMNVRSSHTVYVDGRAVGGSGVASTDRDSAVPRNLPHVAEFRHTGETLELAVAVSNYRYGNLGGIFDEIRFGPASAVQIYDQSTLAVERGFAILFAATGLFFLLLFFFRRRNPEILAFGLLFLFYLIYWLTHGHKHLFHWLPGITYTGQTRIQVVDSFGIILSFYYLIKAMYGRYLHRYAVRVIWTLSLAFLLFSVVAPVESLTRVEPYMIGMQAMFTFYLVGVMLAGVVSGPNEPVYTVAAAFCLLYNGLFQAASFLGLYPPDGVPPVEIPLFLISMAFVMAKRFFAMLENEEKLTGQLRLADRLKNDFLANTSHELRGPLHGMINLAQMLREDWRGERRHEERLATLAATGRRLLHVLDEMLDLAKLNEGVVPLQRAPVDLRMSVAAALEVMSHLSDGTMKLENRVRGGLPYAWVDAHRVMQMLFNLLHLAGKPGGARTAYVEAAAAGYELAVTVYAPGDWAGSAGDPSADGPELAICRKLAELHGGRLTAAARPGPHSESDLPEGQDAEHGARLYDGKAADSPERARYTGVRITLPVAAETAVLPDRPQERQAAAGGANAAAGAAPAMAGRALASDRADTADSTNASDEASDAGAAAAYDRESSASGVNPVFDRESSAVGASAAAGRAIVVAKAPFRPGSSRRARRDAVARPGAPRVLAAGADEEGLRETAGLLEREGLAVTAVLGGRAALAELATQADWDLVVLDVIMPDLSGYDVCRDIRRRHPFYDLPVLFLTSRSQPADLLVGAEAGGNDFALKPLDVTEFSARVRTLLRLKQAVSDKMHVEMALIQAQIRPHFLFNTLNTIASLSETDPERMRDVLAEFGHYLRSSFDLRNLERFVSFESEWSLVESYLYIEQARFGSRITVDADVPEDIRFSLPPLSVQPLVENALRHGILKRPEGGRVSISVRRDAAGVRVTVADDGVGFPKGRAEQVLSGDYRGGIGLTNIHRRLTAYYGAGLAIDSEAGRGTTISFIIPERKEAET